MQKKYVILFFVALGVGACFMACFAMKQKDPGTMAPLSSDAPLHHSLIGSIHDQITQLENNIIQLDVKIQTMQHDVQMMKINVNVLRSFVNSLNPAQ